MTLTHMERLITLLNEHCIPFEVTVQPFFNSLQVWYPNQKNNICDIICHKYSCGGPQGYLEMMGLLTPEESKEDSVVGWLTSGEVFDRILDHYNTYLRSK